MDSASAFVLDHVIIAIFINGLTFFIMGLAVALMVQKTSTLALAKNLWLLSAYGFLRAIENWMRMFWLIDSHGASVHENLSLELLNVLVLSAASFSLIQFAVKSIVAVNSRYLWVRWVPKVLLSSWLVIFIHAVYTSSTSGPESFLSADTWCRYLLHFPALLLASLALFTHIRIFRETRLPHIARDCFGAGASFGLKAILAGLIASPSHFLLSSLLDSGGLLKFIGLPVQVILMLTNLAITYFIVRILKIFAIEQSRQVESATQERFQAQREALEDQQKAHLEIEQRSNQLENVVNTISVAISDALSRIDNRIAAKEKTEGILLPVATHARGPATSLGQPLELEEMLNIALRKILEFTGFEAGNVFVANARGKELALVAHQGSYEIIRDAGEMTRLLEEPVAKTSESGEFIGINALLDGSEPNRWLGDQRLLLRASVPLKFKNKVQGILNLASKEPRLLTGQQMTLLTAMGQQIGVAIQGVRLYDRVQNVAILEERVRIGRELHDGLAQVLGYLHLKSKVLERLLSSDGADQALAELHEMQEVSRDAYRDVRESILGLRTTVTQDKGLIPTLRQYLHLFSQQCGIRAELVSRPDVKMEFEPHAEIQLLRIVQEALTNVRKHSQASRAWVRFEAEQDEQLLIVEDNGRGFDPSRMGQDLSQHFGLKTMRERAEGVGGSLEISTQPGQGVKVIVRMPLIRTRGG
jgi:signal transduction histidine kinase